MTGTKTKDRILDAAEHLFAVKGIGNTSTRDITGEAETNLASVNYHFGSKEGLVEEMLARRILPINRERERLLAKAKKENDGVLSVEDILRAFIEPPLLMMGKSTGKKHFVSMMGQVHLCPDKGLQEFVHKLFHDVLLVFFGELCKALPNTDRAEIMSRFSFVIGAMIHTLMQVLYGGKNPSFCDIPVNPPNLKNLKEQLITFARKGMEE